MFDACYPSQAFNGHSILKNTQNKKGHLNNLKIKQSKDKHNQSDDSWNEIPI